jgi:hypothetical protein
LLKAADFQLFEDIQKKMSKLVRALTQNEWGNVVRPGRLISSGGS